MYRPEEISTFIIDNIRDPDVMKKANEKFKFTEKEFKAVAAIEAVAAMTRVHLDVIDSMGEFVKDGKAMIEEARIKHGGKLND